MKNFISTIKYTLSEFLGTQVTSEIDFFGGRFVVNFKLTNSENLITDKDLELVSCQFTVDDEPKIVSEFIDFSFLGYPDLDVSGLSLEESKKLILEKLGTEKVKFILKNLKK